MSSCSMRAFLLCFLLGLTAAAPICDQGFRYIMQDMHDGDQKQLDLTVLPVRGYVLTITPHGNNQTWVVKTANWDAMHCNASIDFNVPGKPAPPPVPLTLSFFNADGDSLPLSMRRFAVFNDPSGTLAPSGTPLNAWVGV